MNSIANVSRRDFIRGMFSTGALVLGGSLMPESLWAKTSRPVASANGAVLSPNVFVAIQSDNTISIVAARFQMGTGISTSLPMVLADELDAEWTKVQVHQGELRRKNGRCPPMSATPSLERLLIVPPGEP